MTRMRLRPLVIIGLLSAAVAPTAARAQIPSPSGTADRPVLLAPGIRWYQTVDPRGPWRLSVVRIDLTSRDIALRAVHAGQSITGRETVTAIAGHSTGTTARVRVALNADFFDLKTGQSENNQVTDGEWWRGLMVTDSPFDSYDNVHSQLAVSQSGRPTIDRYRLDGRAWMRELMLPILGVNSRPPGTYEGTALYTDRLGQPTPRDSTRPVTELLLRAASPRGDTLRYIVDRVVSGPGGQTVPTGGAVLAAYGDRAATLGKVPAGDTVAIWLGTLPRLTDGRPPRQLIGGWPRLLDAGVNVAVEAAAREGTISRNAEARHPRSAVGISRDGRTLWLLAVDGRSTASVGMTVTELATTLASLGAWDALNFDGGGSTALVIDGRVVNMPSDPTGERAVANALLILDRR